MKIFRGNFQRGWNFTKEFSAIRKLSEGIFPGKILHRRIFSSRDFRGEGEYFMERELNFPTLFEKLSETK